MYLIGVDCSTKPRNMGIALAEFVVDNADADKRGNILVREVHARISDPWGTVGTWLSNLKDHDALIAFDAPLGWPIALGQALREHSAGNPASKSSNDMFRRFTERCIGEMTSKQPFDVGASWIGRTAHAALKELDTLRKISGRPIPLAWWNDDLRGTHAIEVYPAATLKSLGLPYENYRESNRVHKCNRENIANNIPDVYLPDECRETILHNSDGLDALICLFAAADFVSGKAKPPPNVKIDVVTREGWIWCRQPRQRNHEAG